MAGFTELHGGFQPVFSMMWAGNRSENSICQSANGVRKTTVTVRPLLDPFIERMSRYPLVLATAVGSEVGSPRSCAQAYSKSFAVIGTPSDHTAFGFKV